MFKFNLKDEVRDSITGFAGVVYARTEWMNGCITYQIHSASLHEGKPVGTVPFDEAQLELVNTTPPTKDAAARPTGGPPREVKQPNR